MLDYIISILAPYECLSCLSEGSLLCDSCRKALPTSDKRCYKCHTPGRNFNTCVVCAINSPLASVQSATRYTGYGKEMVHKLKFSRAQTAAKEMAAIMAERLGLDRHMAAYEGMLISYAPTATSRVRQRGYDQSRLIARALSVRSGIPCRALLMRNGQLKQVGSDKRLRRQQMQSSYHPIATRHIKGSHILLVDDVCTTGSTLEAAAITLLKAGAARVDGIVFAKA